MRIKLSNHVVVRQIFRTAGFQTSDRHAEGIAKNGVRGDQFVSDCRVVPAIPEALVVSADHAFVAFARHRLPLSCIGRIREGDPRQNQASLRTSHMRPGKRYGPRACSPFSAETGDGSGWLDGLNVVGVIGRMAPRRIVRV